MRASMASIKELSPAKCLLLAARAAAEANLDALTAIYRLRADVFKPELSLRIILSFLPESLESASYSILLNHILGTQSAESESGSNEDVSTEEVDTSSVAQLDEPAARRAVKKQVHLLPLQHSSIPSNSVDDLLSLFLIHRTYLIDARAGLLNTAAELLVPQLGRSEYLRWWYLTTVLPLVRHNDINQDNMLSLDEFDKLDGPLAVRRLLEDPKSTSLNTSLEQLDYGRNMREIVGPWTYGSSIRKRRRLTSTDSKIISQEQSREGADIEEGWESTFEWMVTCAPTDLRTPLGAIDNWDGPIDVDFGPENSGVVDAVFADQQKGQLRNRYSQAAIACIYACEQDSEDAIKDAHGIVIRLSDLLDLDPPMELDAGVDLLVGMASISPPSEGVLRASLQPGTLLDVNNALTSPTPFNYTLLQYYVSAAFLLAKLGCPTSISRAARLPLLDSMEQLELYRKITSTLLNRSKQQDLSWQSCRVALHALRGSRPDDTNDPSLETWGLLNQVSVEQLEKEFLNALCSASAYPLIKSIYLSTSDKGRQPLTMSVIEKTLLHQAYEYYDSASNGNKTRGGVKKAADILSEFSTSFSKSKGFQQLSALISATHAMSYYSLILKPGQPFKPIEVRNSSDPVALVEKILEQNAGSYTKLDDLVQIGRNLAVTTDTDQGQAPSKKQSEAARQELAEHRVIEMGIRAALVEDDFETAYSYVTNRLGGAQTRRPSTIEAGNGSDGELSLSDDFAWRAAFEAGKHRSPAKNSANPLRRPQQRMELLSSALLLAPPSKLPDILAAWRRCEEELLTLLAQEQAAESEFDESADKRASMPGGFGGMEMVQPRRKEIGRGAAEEAPMGLFDVARGAAAAFGRNAGALRGGGGHQKGRPPNSAAAAHAARSSRLSTQSDEMALDADGNRVRKRDMVANAVTGGLVSGLGWVLGAKPSEKQ